MIAGKPIITSKNTPWNNLETHNAGYNVVLTPQAIAKAIEDSANLNYRDYLQKVTSVRTYAEISINREEIKQQYLKLFK